MNRFEIRREQELDGREYGLPQIRVKGGEFHGAICTPNSALAGELVRQANAAADMLAELRWITRCAYIGMPYGGKAYAIRDGTMERAKALVKEWEDA